jgi:pimeloyl-ACP methyl ester carboxylesterase
MAAGGDARSWENNILELAERLYRVCSDLPGYGGSLRLEGDYFIPELSDFLYRFTSALGLGKNSTSSDIRSGAA